MKKAILYIRVSTDEQADKGYSQRHQAEMLNRYCEISDYNVVASYFEDHSAKTFERPEFKKLLLHLRKNKGSANQLLITKWDRFSRNASDAYQMISTLTKLGIEVLAIEQPLDLSIPENKMMLAFYLAAPEVENDRRAMNVSVGMLRAKKEGRFMGKAPLGYSNQTILGKKTIVPNKDADLIRFVFDTLATNNYTTESVLTKAREMGFKCSKNNYWTLIKNPVYYGFIPVPAYRGESAYLQQGTHEPIVSKEIFYNVQDFLSGRIKKQKSKIKFDDHFPLRGFLQCPTCHSTLTASTTTNRHKKKFSYYHCNSKCGQRFRVDLVNQEFNNVLKKLTPHPGIKFLLEAIYLDMSAAIKAESRKQINKIKEDLIKAQALIDKGLNLLTSDKIESDDYLKIKKQGEQKIFELQKELVNLSQQSVFSNNISSCLKVLEELPKLYEESNAEKKRLILGSMFSEKLVFHENNFRTLPLNEAMQLIFNCGKAFGEIKMGHFVSKNEMSHKVNLLALFSNTTLLQLKRIAALAA